MKRSRKLISVLLTLAMLAALLVPMVGPAAAASSYSVSNVKTISPNAKGTNQTVGTVTITVDAGSVTSAAYNSTVYLELPEDFVWKYQAGGVFGSVTGNEGAMLSFPNNSQNDYGFNAGDVQLVEEGNGNRLKLKINSVSNVLKPGVIILQNVGIFVPSGAADGPIKVTAIASSSSVFSAGSFDLAKIGAANVVISVSSTETLGPDGDYVTFYVKESSTGAMEQKTETLKFTLPSGFEWNLGAAQNNCEVYWNAGAAGLNGNTILNALSLDNDDRTLRIDNSAGILSGSYFKLKLKIDVDETTANAGDVEVSIGGKSTYEPSSLVMATYGDYGIKISALDTPDIKAGKYGEKIGKICIEETLKGSLIPNRTVSLTLPYGAKWAEVPSLDWANTTTGGVTNNNFVGISNDCRTIKYVVTMPSGQTTTSDKAKLVFKDGEVITAADFSGDLKVTASGSLGLTDEIVIGKVNPVINASVADKKELKIGVASQAISDLVIEETAKEVIANRTNAMTVNNNGLVTDNGGRIDGFVDVVAPPGVTFEVMPTVTVEGDVQLDSSIQSASLTSDSRVVRIPVTSTSTKPAKITLSNIKLNVDRTVVEGDLKLWIGGTALVDDVVTAVLTNNYLFEPQRYAASVVVGTVITPAPGETRATAEFVIGSTTYKVSGAEKTMDVAPYIKNGRTYLPVRYVAEALGVSEDNIIWDAATSKVTLIKGDKVIQLTIGSKAMIVNGVTITMDVPAEITSGRTMLPFRFIAQALGATVGWDEATQTVTLN